MHAYACIVRPEVIATMKLLSLPCYCSTLRQAARSATTLYETALADSGLHVTQYTVLYVLGESPNLTTTELADAIGIDQTTATRTLALIKKKRLVVNAPGNDRRERRWVLTPGGKRWFESLDLHGKRRSRHLKSRLGVRKLRRSRKLPMSRQSSCRRIELYASYFHL